MTPERRAYAEKRLTRLRSKEIILQEQLMRLESVDSTTIREIRPLEKQLVSTRCAIRRWKKELQS